MGVKVELLVGGMRQSERKALLEDISSGDAGIVVGTHAVISDDVNFARLGLVVIDEQHRFGVAQRSRLRHKGRNPNLLVMTATPIPRTLCLTLYGDLDVSVLDEMPPGRRTVETRWLRERQVSRAYEHVAREVRGGRQAFIVCPRIEASDDPEEENTSSEARAATVIYRRLADGGPLSRFRLALLHGRMKTAEKDRIMDELRRGEVDVLVSTTVIEVGIDIPNATVMIILGAERFGLAQLHQLRGRVGRGKHDSFCYLVTDCPTDESRRRIETMISSSDGFDVAEADLALRGPGDFFGVRQSGLPSLHVADLARDVRLLEDARRAAFDLVNSDPSLAGPSNRGLRVLLNTRYRHCVYFRS